MTGLERRRSREIALAVLYSAAQGNQAPEQTFSMYEHEPARIQAYALKLIDGVRQHQEAITDEVRAHTQHWDVERIAVVDRVLLSIAVYEMKYAKPPVKPAIAANEAVELAKEFGGEAAPKFINGVLGSVISNLRNSA